MGPRLWGGHSRSLRNASSANGASTQSSSRSLRPSIGNASPTSCHLLSDADLDWEGIGSPRCCSPESPERTVHSVLQCHHIAFAHVRLRGEVHKLEQSLTSCWRCGTHRDLSSQGPQQANITGSTDRQQLQSVVCQAVRARFLQRRPRSGHRGLAAPPPLRGVSLGADPRSPPWRP